MKRLICVILLTLGALSLFANPFFKNRKANKGEMKGETVVSTAPQVDYRAPFVKVEKPEILIEEMMLVVSPNLDKEKGPKFKNYRNFRNPTPTVELGELQLVLLH